MCQITVSDVYVLEPLTLKGKKSTMHAQNLPLWDLICQWCRLCHHHFVRVSGQFVIIFVCSCAQRYFLKPRLCGEDFINFFPRGN